MKIRAAVPLALALALTMIMPVLAQARAARQEFPLVQLPPGYRIEKVVSGLTYATSLAWDDQGRLYVLEAGGQFLEEPPPPRLLRVENGRATEVVNLADKGVGDSAVGLAFFRGAFYITHRDPADRTGAVSRVALDGTVTRLISGIADSQSEHQVNSIRPGPDGRLYFGSGPAGNMAVIGIDNAPFVERSPGVHTTPCRDYVLTGQNFQTPDFRTTDQSDLAVTGAFVPFGTATTPGQVIKGATKCGGAILVFDPANPEGTLRPYADGLRNVIGLAWNDRGELHAAVNGIDIRGSRSIRDEFDATYRIREGAWYGFPDFSAALEPVTEPKFDFPESERAPVVVGGQPQPGKPIRPVIDHRASGLTPPDKALVYGLHEWNSSPSGVDFAPAAFGAFAGQLFTAEWGDLAPPTNPLRDKPAGYLVSRIDPATGRAVPFASNAKPGPASAQGAPGQGLERPFDVRFGPDGALYIADYGVARINPARAAQGQVPYEFPPETGAVWKVTRGAGASPAPPSQPTPAPPAPAPQPTPTVVMPGLPNTGTGGRATGQGAILPTLSLAALALAATLGVGLTLVRRRPRRR